MKSFNGIETEYHLSISSSCSHLLLLILVYSFLLIFKKNDVTD